MTDNEYSRHFVKSMKHFKEEVLDKYFPLERNPFEEKKHIKLEERHFTYPYEEIGSYLDEDEDIYA